MGRLRLQRVWVCKKPGQACFPPPISVGSSRPSMGNRKAPWELKLFRVAMAPGTGRVLGPIRRFDKGEGSSPALAAMQPAWTVLWLRLALSLGLALVCFLAVGWASAGVPIYVSSWAVRMSQGYREAERLACKFGFVNLGQVGGTRMDGRGQGMDNPRPQTPTDGGGAQVPSISRTRSPPLPRPTSDSTTFRGHL